MTGMNAAELEFADIELLEQQLKKLPLVAPSNQLDERVRSGILALADHDESVAYAKELKQQNAVDGSQPARWHLRETSIWHSQTAIAVVCLSIGVLVGLAVRSIPTVDSEMASPFNDRLVLSENIPANDRNERNSHETAALAGQTAGERAACWEQRTGQVFDVRTHVADVRFEYCRSCHPAGG